MKNSLFSKVYFKSPIYEQIFFVDLFYSTLLYVCYSSIGYNLHRGN